MKTTISWKSCGDEMPQDFRPCLVVIPVGEGRVLSAIVFREAGKWVDHARVADRRTIRQDFTHWFYVDEMMVG